MFQGRFPCDSAELFALLRKRSARFCFLVWVCVEYFPVARQDGVPVAGVSGGQYPFKPLLVACCWFGFGFYISHIAAFLVEARQGFHGTVSGCLPGFVLLESLW